MLKDIRDKFLSEYTKSEITSYDKGNPVHTGELPTIQLNPNVSLPQLTETQKTRALDMAGDIADEQGLD